MAKSAEMSKIIKSCREQGLVVPDWKDGSGHYLVFAPGVTFDRNRRPIPPEGQPLVHVRVATSPRRDNGVRNDIARLRRAFRPYGFTYKGH